MFQQSDLPNLQKRIFGWAKVYNEAIADLVKRYPDPEQLFPRSLLPHSRRVRLILTPMALAVCFYESEDSWEAVWADDLGLDRWLMSMYNRTRLSAKAINSRSYRMIWTSTVERSGAPEKAVISDSGSLKDWSVDAARADAHNDLLSFRIGELLKPDAMSGVAGRGEHYESPTEAAQDLNDLAGKFEVILSDSRREEEVQFFIKEHPYLLDLRAISVDPKVPLGSEYVTDFVVKLPGGRYLLVELEQASHALYTKSGNPTAQLTHAVRQVEDWLEWSYNNLPYLRSRYPDIHEPKGLVVIGRRSSLDSKAVKSLRRSNVRREVQVVTYDDLIDDMKAIAANLERGTIPRSTGVAYN